MASPVGDDLVPRVSWQRERPLAPLQLCLKLRDALVPRGQLVEQPRHVALGVRVVRQVAPAAQFLLVVVVAFGVGHTIAFRMFGRGLLPNSAVNQDASEGG